MLSGSAAAPLGPIQPATLHWAQPCVHRSARSLNEMPAGPFEESGASQLKRWFLWSLSQLACDEVNSMAERLKSGVVRSIGSVCSGTDAPVLMYEAFDDALQEYLGNGFATMGHGFSTEVNPKKRKFLLDMYEDRMHLLFHDACLLDQNTSYDDVSGKHQIVPRVSDLVGGFPCVDVSGLNAKRKQAAATVKDGSMRTGRIFHAIMNYAKAADSKEQYPGTIVLENVLGLCSKPTGESDELSNFDFCVHYLEKIGYFVVSFRLCARQFGFPVSRERVYMLAVREDIASAAGLGPQQLQDKAVDVMSRLIVRQELTRDLDDFLLPEKHPLIQEMFRSVTAKNKPDEPSTCDAKRPRTRSARWPEIHARRFDALGLDWWESGVPNQQTVDTFPGLQALGLRQFEILRMHGFEFPDRKRTINLAFGMGRARSKEAESHIVTPSSQVFLGHRCRLTHGREAMSLQALHFGPRQSRLDRYSHTFLLDLAGNAFMGLCFGAVAVVKEVLLGHCFARAVRAQMAQSIPPPWQPLHRDLPSSPFCEGVEEEDFQLTFVDQ